MMTVATGMGLAAMSGRDYTASLGPLLETLPQIGIDAQAASSVLQGMFAGIVTMFGPTGTEAMYMMADSLQTIWDTLEELEVPAAFDTFVETVLPDLLTAIEDFVPGFATGIIDGLTQMTPLLTALLENIDAEALGRLAGYLLPLAPALTALGIALFFLSPALLILTTLFGILKGGAGLLGIGGAATGGATGAGAVVTGAVTVPLWVPILAALTGAAVGGAVAVAFKAMFPWALVEEDPDYEGPLSARTRNIGGFDMWKFLMGPDQAVGGVPSMEESLALLAAQQGASTVSIYGDIYFPEGMTYEELVQYMQDVINSESKGYPPASTEPRGGGGRGR